ncbi:MAG: sulfite exporter TauE/SafE family protein [Nitrosomonadales bacterium]|nr:sulfite exporter TauE/SafE family protein [Nitrosomonadales bacterium]
MTDLFNPALLPREVTFFSVWLLGLSMGLTACTATCLPFMSSWVLGRGGARALVLRDTGLFIGGRILAYALLGGLAGGAGVWLGQTLKSGLGNGLIGAASIAAGLWLLRARPHAPCGVARAAGGTPPLLLGFSLSFTPCAPLASLLALCAAAGEIGNGAQFGLAFGLGAALTPLLILLPLIGLFGQLLRDNREWLTRWIRYGAALVLIAIGIRRILLAA